jgi:magnesium-transporting ATPase (P-type)
MATYNPPPAGASPVNGTLILVLGILSIVCIPILGPVAWIMGNNAMKTLDVPGTDQTQRSTANIGRILGIIGTVLCVLGIISWIVFGASFFAAARSGALTPQGGMTAPSTP